jgi:hypothetical protein
VEESFFSLLLKKDDGGKSGNEEYVNQRLWFKHLQSHRSCTYMSIDNLPSSFPIPAKTFAAKRERSSANTHTSAGQEKKQLPTSNAKMEAKES